jgi:glycosyltransferase involved in cell wall biosynthesis
MKILIIVENLPVPFDRRVWQEATTLARNGNTVSVICPAMKGYTRSYECLEDIHIYRHPLPVEGSGAAGYLIEYLLSLFFQFFLSFKVLMNNGFDVIHACNPPDNIFIIGGFFKYLLNKKFLFDHHDINPELYIAKFGKKDFFYRIMLLWERLTFKTADVSIATNQSYKTIAIKRGGMDPEKVFIVRSGPDLQRTRPLPPNTAWRNGKDYLVGYVGVMGAQEGLDLLLKGIAYVVHDLKRTDIHFALVGSGTEIDQLKGLASQLKIEEYLTFTGRVKDDVLMEILSSADVCVNPDVVNEMNDKSTMNKIMEYMALGKPIVQFDMTEGRFTAGESSLYALKNDYISFMNKVIELISDPLKMEKMGKYGRSRVVSTLQWKHEAPRLLAAYHAINRS